MKDLISRQAAIDAIESAFDRETILNRFVRKIAISAVRKWPPAQPERQKGEWIEYTEDGYVECPFCHNATNCDGNKDELHFCFSCGADMREDSHETD